MREEYRTKRQIVLDELDGCTALRLIEPQGAFYAFVDVRAAAWIATGSAVCCWTRSTSPWCRERLRQ
mgnify:CR=1 FL=1